ncbi:MAG: hypothetical protein RQ756_01825 [Flavobacteriaceae bacterium]|nr:hypothetical protein [Flavobacteriaceae bacterium]
MAYNRINFLKRVIEIQEITWHHRQKGLFYKEIYHRFIEEKYMISRRTFSTYLGISAKKELKELTHEP